MWWEKQTNRKKPFYKRWKFIACMVLLGLVVLVGLAGEIGWLYIKHVYSARADKFDLHKLTEVNAASVIYDRNNNVLGKIYIQNRDPRPIEDFSDMLKHAVVAAEDVRFYNHHGADYYGMVRAWVRNHQHKHIVQGASTLTQQLARNTYPAQLPSSDKTYDRKILEVFVAERIEQYYSKDEILAMYLNRVYFGSGFYGAETAARGYFGKSAKDLNLSESATLAGLLRNPNGLSPWSSRKACIEARNFVLGRMRDMGYITQAVYDQSTAEDLLVKNKKTKHTESYALDLIRQKVEKEVGLDNASSGGYRIYATIDGDLQKKAQESLQRHLTEVEGRSDYKHQTYAQYDALFREQARKSAEGDSDNSVIPVPEYLQGSVVVIDNSTGGIIAVVGGRDFNHSQYQREFSLRPPGTAFEPFVYAAAFEKGIFPGALFQDAAMDNRLVMIGGTTGILGEWGPERVDNRYEGFIPARSALVKSKNAASVRLGMATGLDKVKALWKSSADLGGNDMPNPSLNQIKNSPTYMKYPSTYLGSSDVSLLEMTMAYTIFPNEGWKPSSTFLIRRIEDKDGTVVFQQAPEKKQVLKPTSAYEVHSALSDVLDWGTGGKAYTNYGLKRLPFAGKTGTSYNFTDEWFLGYSSEVTCGVWAGFDKPQSIYRGAFSSDIALPVWVDIMNAGAATYKPTEIEMPRGLSKYKVCATSGLLATDKCMDTITDKVTGQTVTRPTTYYEIGTPEQAPKDYCQHGENGPMNAPQAIATGAAPQPGEPNVRRAEPIIDPNAVSVPVQDPTVLGGEDPYNAVSPAVVASGTAAPGQTPITTGTIAVVNTGTAAGSPTPKPDIQVRRADPVRPFDDGSQDSKIKITPPPPIDF